MKNTKVLILLEEQNEHRGLTHVVSEEAFRYSPPESEDSLLYVVGYDKNGNIHFLSVEDGENDDVTLRVVEDKDLFDKLINYFHNNSHVPICEEDEKLRRSIGLTEDSSIKQTVAKLEISRME